MKNLFVLTFLVASASTFAQTGTEIILCDLKIKKDKVIISNPQNITKHTGYDNQPSFHPDQPFIYYSSFNNEDRADIKRYNIKDGTTINITTTSEREYSPTLTPDKQFLSCIIQRDNGAQDLGKYPVDGGEPTTIIDNLTVGYHVWLDNSHLGLFILGSEGKPHNLHFMRLPTKEDTVVATNIGRSLHKIPNERALSFVQQTEGDSKLMKFDTGKLTVTEMAKLFGKNDHIAWTPDGKIITSDGAQLYFMNTKKKRWMPIVVEGNIPELKSITRIAVNAKGDKVAIVVAE